ncbi:hypothetical protein J4E08_10090 [Sagittula sp. NFXS13]|uniref:hypothetical protein n=1 Tax=Sagittula sp. NFXS13 TaxID=2819095 RepID=UPI0032DF7E89
MAYRIAQERRITNTVTTVDGQTFGALFRMLTDEDLTRLANEDGGKAAIRATVIELTDIENEDGQPIPYTPKILEAVISFPSDALAIQRAYNEAVFKAAMGN